MFEDVFKPTQSQLPERVKSLPERKDKGISEAEAKCFPESEDTESFPKTEGNNEKFSNTEDRVGLYGVCLQTTRTLRSSKFKEHKDKIFDELHQMFGVRVSCN